MHTPNKHKEVFESVKYRKLRGEIRSKYGTQEAFATAMSMNESTLSSKLRGVSDWRCKEIELAVQLLSIDVSEVSSYFFNQ